MEASVANASSAVGSGDSPGSTGTNNSSAGIASKRFSGSFTDTYSCLANDATSGRPRSCYACVNIALRSGAKCAVSPNGDCVDEANASQLYQSQANVQLNSSVTTIYYSANHIYCERSDAVCSQCRATWCQEYLDGVSANSSAASPRVCVGSAGCVCLAVCETFQNSNLTCIAPPSVPTATTAPATMSPTQMDTSQLSNSPGDYAWLLVFLALFVLMSVWPYQQNHSDENLVCQLFRGKKRAPPRGPTLSLSGWLEYREKLIEEERAGMMEGKMAPKKTLTLNGPDVTVQVGEGYRPASPSHVGRR